jgi:hypothetical protein
MRTSNLFAVLAAALMSTASAGIYYIDNYCSFPLYLISTSTPPQPSPGSLITLQPNTTSAYMETMRDAGKSPFSPPSQIHVTLTSPLQATASMP